MLPTLESGVVNLLRENVDTPRVPVSELERLLSTEELVRADRFRFENLRRRHIVAWGVVRLALGSAMDQAPESVRFRRNDYGKPFVEGGPSFNLSHSGDQVLLGITPEGRLGVDIEATRPVADLEGLANRVFSDEELREFRALSGEARIGAFYRGWTRKEALIKGVGMGLSFPLTSLAVRLDPAEGNALLRMDGRAEGASPDGASWWVGSLPGSADTGMPAALAWDGGSPEIRDVKLDGA